MAQGSGNPQLSGILQLCEEIFLHSLVFYEFTIFPSVTMALFKHIYICIALFVGVCLSPTVHQ